MNVKDERNLKTKSIRSLSPGDVFLYRDLTYIKTNDGNPMYDEIVSLVSGVKDRVPNSAMVEPIKAVLKIYDDNKTAIDSEPKREIGHWEKDWTDSHVCSKCGEAVHPMPTCLGIPLFRYCPWCGAKMEDEE